jgi:hypothetical protein
MRLAGDRGGAKRVHQKGCKYLNEMMLALNYESLTPGEG